MWALSPATKWQTKQQRPWNTTKSEFTDAPFIDELPMAVEFRLVSYAPENCRLAGEIVNVSADESVLDENGKLDPDKLRPSTFDPIHNAYRVLGEKVGNAFQDGAIQVGNVFGPSLLSKMHFKRQGQRQNSCPFLFSHLSI